MTWRSYLQSRSRNPLYLWRMAIGILIVGVVAGGVADWAAPAWIHLDPMRRGETRDIDPEPNPEPKPEEGTTDWKQLTKLSEDGQWAALWRAIPIAIVHTWKHAGATALAILTGVCWMAFAVQSVQPRSWRDGRLWLTLLAPALGVLSIWLVMFLIFWQEQRWNVVVSDELLPGLRYFILGVGLREELAKFVCFLPLLPWCVWRRDELAALVMAGCVGIGFAMEENVNYIYSSVGTGTLGRLLMPAPFHMTMTGLIGLAAYRACVWPKEWGPIFAATFAVVVLAHGLYDSFFALPALHDYALFSMLIFIGLIYQFFHELRPKQALRTEAISLTANFLFCVSTVAAATFVYLCAAMGFQNAVGVLGSAIAAEGVMVYLFLREMPETMVTV